MDEKQDDFYQKLRLKIANYLDKKDFAYGDILLLAPDFFHLLVKLSLDPRVETVKKAKLAFAITYFFSPIDLLPEAILGPIGYLDDIAVAAYILNDYVNNNESDLLYEHWAGQSDVLASIQNVLTMANRFLGEGLWKRVKNKIGAKF
ncbi:MAG: DUF1232 domain-containing protein [Calditrichaeota bacterium]|nr:MAG: DUF1232 domain-containing protein [Calditrichota bacterium]MBL1205887.1 DUF1232 domain-containing protein [Calditrichota bacterium]NOG45715.1 DUF1232 domain-containing protein [Calditrichota bacterium]